jgi:tetratricopeptide (TPR) repeat protein
VGTCSRAGFLLGAILSLALSGATGAAAQAREDEAQARIHFEAGRAHYNYGRFARAAEEFTLAYELSGNPALLYDVFIAYRDDHQLERAVEALQAYLDLVDDQPNRPGLEARLAAMKRQLAERQPAPGEARSEEEAFPPPQVEPVERARKVRPGPIALFGAGGALGVGAIITGVMAKKAESDVDEACPTRTECDAELQGKVNRVKRLGPVTDVLWVTGAVAVVGGLVWSLMGRGDRAKEPAVSFGCGPGGCSVAYERAF